jgi:hypothetical protein
VAPSTSLDHSAFVVSLDSLDLLQQGPCESSNEFRETTNTPT